LLRLVLLLKQSSHPSKTLPAAIIAKTLEEREQSKMQEKVMEKMDIKPRRVLMAHIKFKKALAERIWAVSPAKDFKGAVDILEDAAFKVNKVTCPSSKACTCMVAARAGMAWARMADAVRLKAAFKCRKASRQAKALVVKVARPVVGAGCRISVQEKKEAKARSNKKGHLKVVKVGKAEASTVDTRGSEEEVVEVVARAINNILRSRIRGAIKAGKAVAMATTVVPLVVRNLAGT